MTIEISNWRSLSDDEQRKSLQRPAMRADRQITETVQRIVLDVRSGGDAAIAKLTRELDKVRLADFRVNDDEFAYAESRLSSAQLDAIDTAIENVRRFHEAQVPRDVVVETMPGVVCERTSHPIDAVGLYVPAGTAPLPSAAIMLAVPARIAGCPQTIICTPPRPDGTADAAVLVAARRAGTSGVFKIGGAQAIAAMAYGTETVPKVHKIFGPGNAWVTEAKSQVAADPGGAAIDMPAGPSEVLVIADDAANPSFVAADLLSQAEHGTDSQVVLLSNSRELAERVAGRLSEQIARLSRREIAEASIRNSRLIITDDIDTAIDVSNSYAPEHLILHLKNARERLHQIRNAGSIFLGQWSPESAGDYCSGTNHVLPTYGFARSYSGLSVDQFMRQMTIQELSEDGLRGLGPTIVELAALEGLDAHAAAVTLRLDAAGAER